MLLRRFTLRNRFTGAYPYLFSLFMAYFMLGSTVLWGNSETGKSADNAKKTGVRILAIGDSLTFGYEVGREKTWPALLQKKLREHGFDDLRVINAGMSGATSAFGLSALKFHLKRYTPDLLIYALGANDGLRGLDPGAMEDNMKKTLSLAKSKNIKILLLGMKAPPNYGKTFPTNFEAAFSRVAKEQQVAFIPFFLEGVAGRPELNQPDGIHPNPKGYEIITETIFKATVKLL